MATVFRANWEWRKSCYGGLLGGKGNWEVGHKRCMYMDVATYTEIVTQHPNWNMDTYWYRSSMNLYLLPYVHGEVW